MQQIFEAMEARLGELLPGCYADRIVYHYTGIDVLDVLMSDSADLYGTHSEALNDDAEFWSGYNYVLRFLREKKGWSEIMISWATARFKERFEKGDIAAWVMSFSREEDSLYQWVAYTDRKVGGCAIGFDRQELDTAAKSSNANYPNVLLGLSPCLYLCQDEKVMDGILDLLYDEFLQGCYGAQGATMPQIQNKLELVMVLFSALVKHESFKCEREWRLLALTNEQYDSSLVSIIGRKPRLPFQVFGPKRKVRDAVRKIVISPQGLTKVNKTAVKLICRKYGLQEKIAIDRSNSPYNGL